MKTNVYIIGANRFNGLKKRLYDTLISQKESRVLAVGFSTVFDHALKKKDYENLHALENKAIEDADIIILVDNDEINGKPYVGDNTQREIYYCKSLKKRIFTSDMLFDIYLKKRV